MLLDILNSVIYLLVAYFISLGCLAVFGINLKKLPDEQSVLDWVNAYREKYYIPFSGRMRNNVSTNKNSMGFTRQRIYCVVYYSSRHGDHKRNITNQFSIQCSFRFRCINCT